MQDAPHRRLADAQAVHARQQVRDLLTAVLGVVVFDPEHRLTPRVVVVASSRLGPRVARKKALEPLVLVALHPRRHGRLADPVPPRDFGLRVAALDDFLDHLNFDLDRIAVSSPFRLSRGGLLPTSLGRSTFSRHLVLPFSGCRSGIEGGRC